MPKKAKKPKKADEDFSDDEGRSANVTMAQKQELADKIQVADGEILNQAILIIQQSMPLGDVSVPVSLASFLFASNENLELTFPLLSFSFVRCQSSEEIELDIESLPAATVLKLYNLVVRGPKKPRSRKGGGGGNKGGTGGLNRKSMDEGVEAERIRKLEAQAAAFEAGPACEFHTFEREGERGGKNDR
ncbi:hypothetical protein BDY24DRAFT_386720 [Mrakia frigida]|uniref:BET domain-containing protein n=1 Tax=Mrakia frigida TaxID=29902 RepID=UPI003FCC1324